MKILVTGGAGYIGSHCCKLLANEGHEPVVFDNLSLGHKEFVKWGPLVEGDILDYGALLDAIHTYKPEAVMHFAAHAIVSESVRHPEMYYANNVTGTINILSAMKETGIRNLVFSSSCAVYGEPSGETIREDVACNPINPYGWSKLFCERIMDDFDRAHGLKSFRLRYFNAAGADPEMELGEDRSNETHLVPIALDAAARRRDGISIMGDDFPTPDGSAVRDYIHVMDIAAAHLKALNHLEAGAQSGFANLGTGFGASVKQVIDAVEKVTGQHLDAKIAARRDGDPAFLVAQTSNAQELLGWVPERSDLFQIIEDAWNWHRARFAQPEDTSARVA